MYTKEQVLENERIVIHCENEQEWEECKKEFPNITNYEFLAYGCNCMRPGGGIFSVAEKIFYNGFEIITYKNYKQFNYKFPEKWWVYGGKEFVDFVNSMYWSLGKCGGYYKTHRYWLNSKDVIGTFSTPDTSPNEYTQVTLEELIAHYVKKKEGEEEFPEKWYVHGGSQKFISLVESNVFNSSQWLNGNVKDLDWGYCLKNGNLICTRLSQIPDYKFVTIEQLIKHYKLEEKMNTTQKNWKIAGNKEFGEIVKLKLFNNPDKLEGAGENNWYSVKDGNLIMDDREHASYLSGCETITIQEVKKIFNIPQMTTFKITRTQLKQIHDIACNSWKSKILDYAKRSPLEDIIEFTYVEVKEMFDAADSGQKKTLLTIFVNYSNKPITREELKNSASLSYFQEKTGDGAMIGFSSRHNGAFYLSNAFKWRHDENDPHILICEAK